MNIDFKKLREQVEKIKKAGEIEKLLEYDTCYNRFFETAKEYKNRTAILYLGNSFTYGELLKLIDSLALALKQLGIKKDEIVTVGTLGGPYSIALFYALDKLGATQHLVNCASNIEEIKREMMSIKSKYFFANDLFCSENNIREILDTGTEYIITISLLDGMKKLNSDKFKYLIVEKLKGSKKSIYNSNKIMNIEQLLSNISSNDDLKPVAYEKQHDATIAYTSGSTGNSKACVATWEGIDSMVQIMAMTEQGRFKAGEIMFSTFPLWIYYSLLNMIHEPLCLGVTLAIDPLFEPKNIGKRNKQYKFNHWLTIPPYLKKVVALNKKIDCSNWRIVLTGGAELPNDLKYSMDDYISSNGGTTKVVQGYGASECLGSFAYCYYPDSTVGCLGKPNIGNLIKILDLDTKEEVKTGESGVGYFYSPSMMRCYYGDEEATNHNLVKDENGVIWYNTEDLIHQNEKGEIFLDGRIRRIVITKDTVGNYTKLIPDKVKKELQNNKCVDKCEVITVADEERENVAIAFVVKCDETDEISLKTYLKDCVPEYMMPTKIIFIEDIPLTPANKPDLKALENIYSK